MAGRYTTLRCRPVMQENIPRSPNAPLSTRRHLLPAPPATALTCQADNSGSCIFLVLKIWSRTEKLPQSGQLMGIGQKNDVEELLPGRIEAVDSDAESFVKKFRHDIGGNLPAFDAWPCSISLSRNHCEFARNVKGNDARRSNGFRRRSVSRVNMICRACRQKMCS